MIEGFLALRRTELREDFGAQIEFEAPEQFIRDRAQIGLSRSILEPAPISQSEGDAVAEGVEEVVFTIASLSTHTKAFDLVEQVIACMALIDSELVEGVLCDSTSPRCT